MSLDGTTIAVGSAPDGIVHVMDAVSGKSIRTFETNQRGVQAVLFSPDGRSLLATRAGDSIDIWNLESGKAIVHIETSSWVDNDALAFSPDGRTLASAHGDRGVRVWDCSTGKELRSLQAVGDVVRCIIFSPDGKTIAAGTEGSSVIRWDNSGHADSILRGYGSPIRSLSFSPDGEFIAAGGSDQVIHLWRSSNRERVGHPGGHQGHVEAMDFSPDGGWVASSGCERAVRIWQVSPSEEKSQLEGLTPPIQHVLFSPSGEEVAAGGGDGTVRVWNASTGKERLALRGHTGSITCLAYSPDGLSIASGSGDRTLRLWDLKAGKETRRFTEFPENVLDLTFSPDLEWLALGYSKDSLFIWKSGSPLNPVRLAAARDTAVFFSEHGRHVMTWDGEIHQIIIWDSFVGRKIGTLKGPAGVPLGLSWDGRVLFLADEEKGYLRMIETASAREFLSVPSKLDHLYCPRLSRDGKALATVAQDTTIPVWTMAPPEDLQIAARWHRQAPDLPELWDLLASQDIRLAYLSQWRMAESGPGVVKFLREHLLKCPDETSETIGLLVADVEGDLPEIRSRAQIRLESLAPYFEETLREYQRRSTGAEVRNRLQGILEKLYYPVQTDPDVLRHSRALTVLERLGSEDSFAALREISANSRVRRDRVAAQDAINRKVSH